MKTSLSSVALAFAALHGCGVHTDDGAPDDGVEPGAPGQLGEPGQLGIVVGLPDGARVTGNVFASKADVFLNAMLTRVALPYDSMTARDYYFRVVDAAGTVVSTDDPRCRRIRIGAHGRIDLVYGALLADVVCPHATGLDQRSPIRTGVTVGLAPFDDGGLAVNGAHAYAVELFEADQFDGVSAPAMGVEFEILGVMTPPPGGPVCGDGVVDPGEGCDDGNTSGQDGCNAHCEVEHLCCCGNGALEPGEQCDDGNQDSGDGCTSACVLE